jgi:hypothetical protein
MRILGVAAITAAAVMGSSAMAVTTYASRAHGGSGHASSHGGNGGRASASGGTGGDSTGGNGILCGVLSGIASNDINNLLGGQTQLLNGVNLLDNLFVPVLSPGGKPDQSSKTSGSTIKNSRGAVDSGRTGNSSCGSAGDAGNGGRGGRATGGRGGSGGKASAHGGSARNSSGD